MQRPQPAVFISCRRSDGSAAMGTRPLYKTLTRAFGMTNVLMDTDNVPPPKTTRPVWRLRQFFVRRIGW